MILETLQTHNLTQIPEDWPEQLEDISRSQALAAINQGMTPFSLERLQALLSLAAGEMLEPMAQAASSITRQRFGRIMNLYAPLYLSNLCTNCCRYCGFGTQHHCQRQRLSLDDAVTDAGIIAGEGFRDILLVSGEDREHVTMEYLVELARRLRGLFASISVEIFHLTEDEYRILFNAGIDGVTLYQETYDRNAYAYYHPRGPKSSYEERLKTQERAARAGMRRLGIGALLGLCDWRFETMALALHAHILAKHFWQSRVSISFPRLCPANDVEEDYPHLLSDRDLVQMILALRLCFPDVNLVLSTREPPALRDQLLHLGITQMSAGSRTSPGGYSEPANSTEQFAVSDTRPVKKVVAHLQSQGFDPVWKDWDPAFIA